VPNPSCRFSESLKALLAAQRGAGDAGTSPHATRAGDPSQLIFIGNWQDACPRRLLFDEELEAIDIVTWQVVRVYASATQMVAFPTYEQLMGGVRVSRATLARSLAVLRLTGWLPLCAALRDARGRFAGHLYALNDEPLPLGETLEIDATYVAFVEQARVHRSAHVRGLAQRRWNDIANQAVIDDGPALAPVRMSEHVADRVGAMLKVARDRVQNLNAGHRVQNLNPVGSSSVESENTTTTPEHADRTLPPADEAGASVVFPETLALNASQRRVLELRLLAVAPELRQAVLDEAAGRIRAKRSTSDPVHGEFVLTDAGERVRAEREERAQTDERLKRAREYSEAQRLKEIERHRLRRES
jgi:hypothetical protein